MFTDWRRAGALYTSGMKRVYLVRGARPSAEYSVAVPAGTGHLESTAPFRLRTEEGETFASGRASGRHVIVLPVSRVDRAATILPGLEIDIADSTGTRDWQTTYYAQCASLAAKLTVSAVPFTGGAAAAQIPPGWVGWSASFVWTATNAAGEYPSTATERDFMRHPAAILDGDQPIGVVVPPGAKWAAARAPFTLFESYADPASGFRSTALVDSAAAEYWYVVDLHVVKDRPCRMRFALDAAEAVLCWGA